MYIIIKKLLINIALNLKFKVIKTSFKKKKVLLKKVARKLLNSKPSMNQNPSEAFNKHVQCNMRTFCTNAKF